MSVYLVNSQDLTSVANAIRTKGDTQAPLTFPNGFISAVNDISTGTDPAILAAITDNGTNFNYMFYKKNLVHAPELDMSNATTATFMFSGCSKLKDTPQYDLRNVTDVGSMFDGCTALKKINIKNTGKITRFFAFAQRCTHLTDTVITLDVSGATNLGSAFYGSNVTEIHFNDTSKVVAFNSSFYSCSSLVTVETLDFSAATSVGATSSTFYNATNLRNIIIVENSLKNNLSFTSSVLTDKSYEYIANSLNPNVTGKVIGLLHYTETEARLKALMGVNNNGHFTLDSNGDISVYDFILNVKGWSIVK